MSCWPKTLLNRESTVTRAYCRKKSSSHFLINKIFNRDKKLKRTRREESNVSTKKGNFRNNSIKFTQPSHQGNDRHCFIAEIMENGKPGKTLNRSRKILNVSKVWCSFETFSRFSNTVFPSPLKSCNINKFNENCMT